MRLNNILAQRTSRAQKGFSLVELMVGITVGLIVAAGAATVATRQINEHRRLMLEVQMQQDLRIVTDLLQQELRRAGYRGDPANGVWQPAHDVGSSSETPAKPAASSPYAEVTQSQAGSKDIFYQYAKPPAGSTTVNASNVLAGNEQFGFKLENETLFMQLGMVNGQPNWQPVTDPDLVRITNFLPVINEQTIELTDLCNCTAGVDCPIQTIRRVQFTINAVAKSDANVKRTLRVSEKVRADDISGACPA